MRILLLTFLVSLALSASAQINPYAYSGDTAYGDTSKNVMLYRISYWDTTGIFDIPPGCLSYAIKNRGDADGSIRTRTDDGWQTVPADGDPLNFVAPVARGTRREGYFRLPGIECDATGTDFQVIIFW